MTNLPLRGCLAALPFVALFWIVVIAVIAVRYL